MCAESPTRNSARSGTGRPPVRRAARCHVDNLNVDLGADRLKQRLPAPLAGELIDRFAVAGEVSGHKHAEVALGHHEYPGHVGIIDLDGVAIAQVRDELAPRCPEVDEDNEYRQFAETRRRDAQLSANRAVRAIGGEEVVGVHRRQRTAVEVLYRRNDAVLSWVTDSSSVP